MNGPLPEDSAERKTYPMHAVISGYFPAALAKVSHHSYLGNEKHNPGEPLHWARGKSDDHLDAAMRHMVEGDLTGAAWRILAALQLECEAAGAPVAPLARGARGGKGGVIGWIGPSVIGGYMPGAMKGGYVDPEIIASPRPAYDAHPGMCYVPHGTFGEAVFDGPTQPCGYPRTAPATDTGD